MRLPLFFFLFFFPLSLFPQAQEHPCPDALFRYWEFKDRLHKHFVALDYWGDGIGEWDAGKMRYERAGFGLPAAQLIVVPEACRYWQYLFDSGYTPPEVLNDCTLPNVLKWGDTPTDLGYYMALLATEYELLRINSQHNQKKKTLHAIFLALQAYRRLDMTANHFYAKWIEINDPDCQNFASQGMCGNFTSVPRFDGYSGFFIRDDTPHSFRHFFNEMANGDSTWQVGGVRGGLSSTEDDPIDRFLPDLNSIAGDNILSQDQMIGILFGLSFIHRFVSEEEKVLGYNIINMVEKIAGGMLNHIQPADEIIAAYRSIRYPGCLQDVKVERGHNASNFYLAINIAISNINPDAIVCTDGEDKQKWEAFAKRACNCNIPFYENCGFNCRMLLELLAMSDEGDFNRHQEKALESNKEAHILAWYILQQEKYKVQDIKQEVFLKMKESLFELPPSCHGPCYRATDEGQPIFECENIYGWCAGNRMKNGNFRASSCNYDGNWYIRGSGVGYMLMYNLFMLTYFPDAPFFNPEDFDGDICFELPNIFEGEKSICGGGMANLRINGGFIPFENIEWWSSSNLILGDFNEIKSEVKIFAENMEEEYGWLKVKITQNGCKKNYSWAKIRLGPPPHPAIADESEKCRHKLCLENEYAELFDIQWEINGLPENDFDIEIGGRCAALTFFVPPPIITNIQVSFSNSCGDTVSEDEFTFDCDELLPKRLKVFPNPISDFLYLEFENLSAHKLFIEPSEIIIYDNIGRIEMIEEINKSSKKIDVTDLSPGIYLCTVLIDGNVYYTKFFKN